jgi:hypothetical protein
MRPSFKKNFKLMNIKIYLSCLFLLGSFSAFSQVAPRNDSCQKAVKICPFGPAMGLQANTNGTNDGTFSCGGNVNRGVWYKFFGYQGGTAVLSVINSGASNPLKMEVYSGDCGALTPVAGTCVTVNTGASQNLNIVVTGGTTYYVLIGSANAGTNVFFSMNISNAPGSPDAVVGETTAMHTITAGGNVFPPNKAFVCMYLEDSVTLGNVSTFRGDTSTKYYLIMGRDRFAPAKRTLMCPVPGTPPACAYTDSTIHLMKTLQSLNLQDTMTVCLRTSTGCNGVVNNSESCMVLYPQELDAKFDTLGKYQLCGQDTSGDCSQGFVNFKIAPPMKPRVNAFTPPRDSAIVIEYKVYVRTPCNTVDSFTFSPTGSNFLQQFQYAVPANCYGQYVAKVQVISPQFCGPMWAYWAKGDMSSYKDTVVRDTSLEFTIYAPPKVAPEYSMNGTAYSKYDTLCSGMDVYIRLPRVPYTPDPSLGWGGGTFTDSLYQTSGPPVTAVVRDPFGTGADSVFKVTVPVSTSFETYKFGIIIRDSRDCYARSGCDTFALFVVKPKITANVTAADTATCKNGTMNLTGNATTGVGPYDFTWFNSGPSYIPPYNPSTYPSTITSLPMSPGKVWFYGYLTDQLGCVSDTDSVVVSVHDDPIGTPVTSFPSICVGRPDTINLSPNPNVGDYVYLWSSDNPGVTILNHTSPNATALNVSAPTTFYLKKFDSFSCTSIDSVRVTAGPRPVLSPGPTTTFCASNASTTAITPVVSSYTAGSTTFSWNVSPAGQFNPANPTTNNPTFTPVAGIPAGTYTFSVTVRDNSMPRLCDSTLSFNVVVKGNPFISVSASPNDTVCEGTPITFTASGASGYVWYNGSTSNPMTAVVGVGDAQVLTVTGTTDGCSSSGSINIWVKPLPGVHSFSGPNQVCLDTVSRIYTVNATPGSTYTWTVGGGGQITGGQGTSSGKIRWNSTGTHVISVTETTQFGCSSVSPSTYTVNVNPKPTTPLIVGNGRPCQFSTEAYFQPNNGSTYVWSLKYNKGTLSSGTGNQINITWNTIGNDTLRVVQTSSLGCVGDTVKLAIDVRENPALTPQGPNPVCEGGTGYVYYVAPAPSSATQYNWSVSDPSKVSNFTPVNNDSVKLDIPIGASGSFNISVVMTDVISGCSGGVRTFPVTINQRPTVSITNKAAIQSPTQFYCVGSTVTINYSSGIGNVVTRSENGGSPIATSGGSFTYTVPAAPAIQPRTDVIVLTSAQSPCSSVTDTVRIKVLLAPSASSISRMPNDSVCNGTPVSLIPTVTNPREVKYLWTSDKGGTFMPANNPQYPASPNVTYYPAATESGITTITLRMDNGACAPATVTTTIYFEPSPAGTFNTASLRPDICVGDMQTLCVTGLVGQATWSINSGPGTLTSPNSACTDYNTPATVGVDFRQVQIGLVIKGQFCPNKVVSVPPFNVWESPVAFAGDKSFSNVGGPVLLCTPSDGSPLSLTIGNTVIRNNDRRDDTNPTVKWQAYKMDANGVWVIDNLSTFDLISNTSANTSFHPFDNGANGGRYKLVLTVLSASGACAPAEDSILVDIIRPVAKASNVYPINEPFCQGAKITLSQASAGPVPYATVKWYAYNPNGTGVFDDDTAVNPTYTFGPTEVGVTRFKMVVTVPCGTATDSVDVFVEENPKVTVTPATATICEDHAIEIKVMKVNPASNYNAPDWSKSTGTYALLDGGWTIRVNPEKDEVYKFTVHNQTVSTTGLGCAYKQDIPISVIKKPKLTAPSEICKGFEIELSDSLTQFSRFPNVNSGTWASLSDPSNSGGFSSTTVSGYYNTVTYMPSQVEMDQKKAILQFTVNGTAPSCTDLNDTVHILLYDRPEITAHREYSPRPGVTDPYAKDKKDSINTSREFYQLRGKHNELRQGATAIWEVVEGTGFFTNPESPDATYYPSDADYNNGKVVLRYKVIGSCDDTHDDITVLTKKIIIYNMVSGRSPFVIKGLPEHSKLQVFDRWGRLVYKSPEGGYKNDWTPEGLDDGTYYYVLTYRLGELKGYFQLLR